jgi:hypothetical protein
VKKYIEHMREQPPHDRRQAALRIATVVTAVIFVGWLATLGLRLATPAPKSAAQEGFESQLASVFSAFTLSGKQKSTLEPVPTDNSTGQTRNY